MAWYGGLGVVLGCAERLRVRHQVRYKLAREVFALHTCLSVSRVSPGVSAAVLDTLALPKEPNLVLKFAVDAFRPLPPELCLVSHQTSSASYRRTEPARCCPSSCFWLCFFSLACVVHACRRYETAAIYRWPSSRRTRGCTGSSSA